MRVPKRRVVVLAAAHLAHARHHARRAVGEVLLEPVLEQRVHLPRQAQHDAERRAWRRRSRAASRMRSISGSLMNGMIGDTLTPTGTPALASVSIVSQPPVRRGGARLQDARERRVERGDRDVDRRPGLRPAIGATRSRSRSMPDDLVTSENGCAALGQHLDDRARDAQLALDRLVGIGGRADVEQQRLVAAAARTPRAGARRR